jgi:hypothetical protein
VTPFIDEKKREQLATPDLRLEVSLGRDSFFLGEPIYLFLRLQNCSEKALPVVPLKVSTSDIEGNLGVVMSREDGVREYHPPYIETKRSSGSPTMDLLPLLDPGDSWIVVVELLSFFSEEKGLISLPENRIRIGCGTYNLQAFYRWDFQPNLVVRSEMQGVSIRKPPMQERLNAWRTRRSIRKMLHQEMVGEGSLEHPGSLLCRRGNSGGTAVFAV